MNNCLQLRCYLLRAQKGPVKNRLEIMSVNYAAGLSPYAHKGKCGQREILDDPDVLREKVERLKWMIEESEYMVAHSGAGISTSSGIPDFRGPNGVWTLEEKGLESKAEVTFDTAQPTFTHKALCLLERKGVLKFLISQNVDGLHLRSGFPQDRIAELHGNVFIEKCRHCKQYGKFVLKIFREIIRENAVPTIGQKLTGNACPFLSKSGRKCRGKLQDIVLDWEDNLPEKDLNAAYFHSERADLSICLGTSLQIQPAATLPLLCKRKRRKGRIVVVNLQKTKIHDKADLVIHAKVDKVMELLLQMLNYDDSTILNSTGCFPKLELFSSNGPPLAPTEKPKKSQIPRKRTRDVTNSTDEIIPKKTEDEGIKTEIEILQSTKDSGLCNDQVLDAKAEEKGIETEIEFRGSEKNSSLCNDVKVNQIRDDGISNLDSTKDSGFQ